jgi:diguanylate cyclase (GGDEF)-like protein
MSNFKHYIEGIKNGEGYFGEQFRFSFLSACMLIFHLILAVLFFLFDCRLISAIASVSVLIYYLVLTLTRKQKYEIALAIASLEVAWFSIITTIAFGFESGFYLYNLAIISIIFYFSIGWNFFKGSEIFNWIYSIGHFVIAIVTFIIGKVLTPWYTLSEAKMVSFIILNIAVAFVIEIGILFLLRWDTAYRNGAMTDRNSKLNEMANKDALTKLYNRRYMDRFLEEKLIGHNVDGKIFGLIMCDIDNFKRVNDTYGHESGDDVLVEIAKVFMDSLRGDDCVCRWGGEEFLVVVDGNKKISVDVAERIRAKINDLVIKTHGREISVTMTFGIAESIPGYNIEKLVEIADEKLYQGKQNGKNQVVY